MNVNYNVSYSLIGVEDPLQKLNWYQRALEALIIIQGLGKRG